MDDEATAALVEAAAASPIDGGSARTKTGTVALSEAARSTRSSLGAGMSGGPMSPQIEPASTM